MLELLALILIIILFINNRTAFRRINILEKRVEAMSQQAARLSPVDAATPEAELAETAAGGEILQEETPAASADLPAAAMATAEPDGSTIAETAAEEPTPQAAAAPRPAATPSGRHSSKPWAKSMAGHQLPWHIGKVLHTSTA